MRLLRNLNAFLVGATITICLGILWAASAHAQPPPGYEIAEYRGEIRGAEKVTCIYVGTVTGKVYTLHGPSSNGPCPGSPEYLELMRQLRQAPPPPLIVDPSTSTIG